LSWGKRAERIKAAEGLLDGFCRELGMEKKELSRDAKNWIARRDLSGDGMAIMKRVIYHAALSAKGDRIEPRHFPPVSWKDCKSFAENGLEMSALEDVVQDKVRTFFEKLGSVETSGVYGAVMKQVERPLFGECLRWAGGNQLKVARVLGVNRNTLRRKMKALGLSAADGRIAKGEDR
jgi:DNA-binding protein Fis